MENDIAKELELHVQELIKNASEEDSTKSKLVRDKKTVTCKRCRETQEWTSKGNFPNGCKKWRDNNGLICNGRLCGECNRDRAGETMKKLRSN